MFLPVLCYMVSEFAHYNSDKNALIENMSQDYGPHRVREGLCSADVIFVHALRDSLIPIATGLGRVFVSYAGYLSD